MTLNPGSFPWLVAHDIRLNWRRFSDMLGDLGPRGLTAVLGAGGLVLHLLAWPVVHWLSPHLLGPAAGGAALAALVACIFSWMIAQSLFGTTRMLFDRGDLDLLLGSPLPAGRVFAAKATAIAASALGSIAFLTLPVANVGALIDRAAWLGAYPVLVALALVATALGVGLSIALFFLVGPRRARLYTQMTGAVIGGAFVLAAQIVAMLPAPMRAVVTQNVEGDGLARVPVAGPLLQLAVEALRGDIAAMALLMGLGVLLFAGTVLVLGERFAAASLAAVGATSGARARQAGWQPRFRAGLGANLRRKEWRLLVRDPNLFAQIGLQIVYTIPIAVVLLRSETLPAALALAPTIVVVAAQVAASLAWITVSGEDAPELIASAPVSPAAVDRAKLSAVALPVLTIVALPLVALALVAWRAALVAALVAVAAAASTALLNFWHPMPGNRRGMLRRHAQSKLIALVEHALAILWAITIVFALLGTWLTLAPVSMALAVLAWSRSRHRLSGGLEAPSRAATPSTELAGRSGTS